MTSALVHPLEPGWQGVVDAVLRRRDAPTTETPARLGALVATLSEAYNAGRHGPGLPLDARIGFSFARDVPKGAAAVRELVAAGKLAVSAERPLRVVDLGAGLGAMTWGIARALEAAGQRGSVEALLVDEDAAALAAAEAIVREAGATLSAVTPLVRTRKERIAASMALPEADVLVLGQVLSEMDDGAEPDARADRHAALLEALLGKVAPDGSLVVVEPALRDRTRHLHAVRDRLAAGGVPIFGPCLHTGPCGALAANGAWCHEDLPVDLPSWLVPVARAAGLRWQGLTFSYLVLRRDDASLRPDRPSEGGRLHLRVVSEALVTKGKREIWACTSGGDRVLLRRLDRERSEANARWDELRRGDVVTLEGLEGTRVGSSVVVDVRRARN